MNNSFSDTGVLILAGGLSQRSETIKGLRKFSGKYWIEQQIEYFLNLKMGFIFIGLGFNYQEYLGVVPLLPDAFHNQILSGNTKLSVIINPNPEKGMFSTLQSSLKAIKDFEFNNLFLIHVDMALPESDTLDKIFQFRNNKVVKPVFLNSGKAGHPILLSKEFCRYLADLSPDDSEARLDYQIRKLKSTEIYLLEVNDPAVCINMNTTEDWQNHLKSLKT